MFRLLLITLCSFVFLTTVNCGFAETAKHDTRHSHCVTSDVPGKYKTSDGKVNLNTIDEDSLAKMSCVGAKSAASIIAYRDANGSFKSVDELKDVKLVGPRKYKKIREEFSLG
jgi:competence ComEA-like helix-hairpin-helix protein